MHTFTKCCIVSVITFNLFLYAYPDSTKNHESDAQPHSITSETGKGSRHHVSIKRFGVKKEHDSVLQKLMKISNPEEIKAKKEVAETLEEGLDVSVNPCDDFWKYACGKVDPNADDLFKKTGELLHEKLIAAVMSVKPEDAPTSNLINVYSYMNKIVEGCLKDDDTEEIFNQIQDILNLIGQSFLLSNDSKWINNKRINVFRSALRLLKATGLPTVFNIKKAEDLKNPKRTALFITLNVGFILRTPDIDAAAAYVLNSTKTHIPPQLIERFNNLSSTLFSEFLNSEANRMVKESITKERFIEVNFRKLKSLNRKLYNAFRNEIHRLEITDLHATRIYWGAGLSHWNTVGVDQQGLEMISTFISNNSEYYQAAVVTQFLNTMFNGSGYMGKRKFCKQATIPALNHAIVRLLLDKENVTEEKTLAIRAIVEHIRSVFMVRLFTLDWLDSYSKNKALNKLLAMTPRLIAPPLVHDNDRLNNAYEYLPEIQENQSLMKLIADVNLNHFKKQLENVGTRSQTRYEGFIMDMVLSTNAFYVPTENTINILLGMLQPPWFDWNYPTVKIYSGIGLIIGHEITHGFDREGAEYDARGLKHPWLTELSEELFLQRSQCFAEQFSKFCQPHPHDNKKQLCVDGNHTIGEIMADDGGIRFSYYAFKSLYNYQNSVEPHHNVPGFENFTNDQMFFLSYARNWCINKITPGDVHPPWYSRVNGSLQNFEPFANAFGCPLGSPMNPERKCQVW